MKNTQQLVVSETLPDVQPTELTRADRREIVGAALVIISATCFGFMAIFAKYAYSAQINLLTILSLRFAIASAVMWSVVLLRQENPRVGWKHFFTLFGLGALGYGLMSTFFFSAVKLIPASLTSILLYTYPVIVTVISSWLYKERITKYKVWSLLISSVGMVMVVGVVVRGLNFTGVFYGAMAALVYSLYIILSNKVVHKVSPVLIATYVMTSAAIMFNIVGWSTGAINLKISGQGWLAILGIAVISSTIAILTFFQGMKLIGPTKASIISTIEPVITTIAAFLLFAEKLSVVQMIGGALVIIAVILIQRDK